VELGPRGLRVICLRSAGWPESIADTLDVHAVGSRVTRDEFIASLKDMTLPKRLPLLADLSNAALRPRDDRDCHQNELRPNRGLETIGCAIDSNNT
jgi:hypothetical protein